MAPNLSVDRDSKYDISVGLRLIIMHVFPSPENDGWSMYLYIYTRNTAATHHHHKQILGVTSKLGNSTIERTRTQNLWVCVISCKPKSQHNETSGKGEAGTNKKKERGDNRTSRQTRKHAVAGNTDRLD
mmetsp:Transcript_62726/g.125689  ORF Transcript_62726/g.125689 Transcript_62726/m.125689 type:complete len:129 (+) Transcript_62726:262-648(+)